MEYVLISLLRIAELFDTRSSHPVIHARKKALLSAYLCLAGVCLLLIFGYMVNVDPSVVRTGAALALTNHIKQIFAFGFMVIALLLSLLGLWNLWVYYRTHSRPELFMPD